MDYTFINDTKLMVGESALENIAYEIRYCGCKRPLLVTDEICKRLGYLKTFLRAFDNEDIVFSSVFDSVKPDADTETCEKLFNLCTLKECDCIVALGRRNVLTAAKIARIMVKENIGKVSSFRGVDLSGDYDKNMPLFVVPVISACGEEATCRAEIFDEISNTVYSFDTAAASVNAVIIDYRMTDIIPPVAMAKFGLYALAMGVCAYLNSGDNTVVKMYAGAAIRDITGNLNTIINRNGSRRYRTRLMSDVVIAGIALSSVGRSVCDELVFSLAQYKGMEIEDMLVALMPSYAMTCDEDKLASVLLYLAGEEEYSMCVPLGRAKKSIAFIDKLYNDIYETTGMQLKLRDYGIDKGDFTEVVSYAIGSEAGKGLDMSYLLEILERAY